MNHREDKLRFSYSHISTFKTCPLQYKFRYIEKIPVPPSKHLSFGSSVHNAIESFQKKFFQQFSSYPAAIDEMELKKHIRETLLESWSNEGFEDIKEIEAWKNKALSALENYYISWLINQLSNDYRPLAVEKFFEIDFDGYTLVGKIDFIDYRTENDTLYYRIIDYKTGEKIPFRYQNSEDLQLYVYLKGAESIINEHIRRKDENLKPSLERILFYYVIINNEIDNKIDPAHQEYAFSMIYEHIRAIARAYEKNIFEPVTGNHCRWCDYTRICDAFKGISGKTTESSRDDLASLVSEYLRIKMDISEKEKEIEELINRAIESEKKIILKMQEEGKDEIEVPFKGRYLKFRTQ